ncbi:MAG: uracil-DNA glycosylase [Hyphomicrobiales bacterium]
MAETPADSRSDVREAARQLLGWYAAMGVDVALAEDPQDRFAETDAETAAAARPRAAPAFVGEAGPAAAPPPRRATEEAPRPTFEPHRAGFGARADEPAEATIMAAREQAAAAATLDELRATMAAFEGCALRFTAKQLVFADGNPEARLMLVGEAPGRDEDLTGLPFVGRAGKLLDRILGAAGLDRTKVYIANVVPWRPPGNRKPTANETEIMRPFLERQIELCGPDMLVALGGAATSQLLKTGQGILSLRGKWASYPSAGREIPLLPTIHPAALLRNSAQKRLVWRDFREVARRLGAAGDRTSE